MMKPEQLASFVQRTDEQYQHLVNPNSPVTGDLMKKYKALEPEQRAAIDVAVSSMHIPDMADAHKMQEQIAGDPEQLEGGYRLYIRP